MERRRRECRRVESSEAEKVQGVAFEGLRKLPFGAMRRETLYLAVAPRAVGRTTQIWSKGGAVRRRAVVVGVVYVVVIGEGRAAVTITG